MYIFYIFVIFSFYIFHDMPSPDAKRKREVQPGPLSASSSDSDECGPRPPAPEEKKRRVMGPAGPPPGVQSMTTSTPKPDSGSDSDSDSDSDDDEFGPKPPSAAQQSAALAREAAEPELQTDSQPDDPTEGKPQRAGWMTLTPTTGLDASRSDPTKLRPGRFNTNRRSAAAKAAAGTAGSTGEIDSLWTESIQDRQRRLQNQVLGIVDTSTRSGAAGAAAEAKLQQDRTVAKRVAAAVERDRGGSLMDEKAAAARQAAAEGKTVKGAEKEDDPSARGFDYQKDVAGAARVGGKQRREMVSRMGKMDSRFAGGNFL